jgi:CarboxypepD_reg-like domain
MKKADKICACIAFMLLATSAANAQKLVSGMVIDSLTLNNLVGVHIKVKGSDRAAISDINGIFAITLYPKDTLILSFVGYHKSKVPVHFDNDIMIVRMHEESIMLKEVVIRDRPYLNRKLIHSPTLSTIKPLKAGGAMSPPMGGAAAAVNFAYFTREEKEKRKLVAVMKELELVRVYVDIVNDPAFREEVMEQNSISESRFYELLAVFNQKNSDLMRSGHPDLIRSSLFFYFEREARQFKK